MGQSINSILCTWKRLNSRTEIKMNQSFKEMFSGHKILITGGLGFIGSNLAQHLVELDAKVLLVDSLIQEFAAYLGLAHSVAVANGADALYLALRACSIGPDDAVVTVSHTAVATVAAIELTGAKPVLVDVDPTTFTMDPNHLAETIKASTDNRLRAIIPVHLYGHLAAICQRLWILPGAINCM